MAPQGSPTIGILARLGITGRLLLAGSAVALALWLGLDHVQSERIREVMEAELGRQLVEAAHLDRQHFESDFRAHLALVRLMGGWRAAGRHVDQTLSTPATTPRLWGHEPDWVPPPASRQPLPSTDFLLVVDADARVREVYEMGGEPPPVFLLTLPRELVDSALDQTRIGSFDGKLFLISSAITGERGGMLVGVSRLNARFLERALDLHGRGPHLIALIDKGGRVAASSDPQRLPVGTHFAEVADDWLIAGKSFFDESAGGMTVTFVSLEPRSRLAELSAPMLDMARSQRTALAAALIGLFLGVLVYLAVRLRGLIRTVARTTEQVFGVEARPYAGGDELRELVNQVQKLTTEVISSREALRREAADRIRMVTEQFIVRSENDRLKLLQSATELMGVGVLRPTADGPVAENAAMADMARHCGGLDAFVAAQHDGLGVLDLGEGSCRRVFALHSADSIEPGLLLVEDITKRHLAEMEVRNMALFPEQNPNPVLRVSADGTVTTANRASAGLLESWGTGPGRALPPNWRAAIAEVLERGAPREAEVVVGERTLSLMMVPLPDLHYVNVYASDVTLRVAFERLLANTNEELERRVAERTQGMAAALEQAEMASRAKTEFLAAMSHELRTPLNAIIGFSEILMTQMFGPLGNPRYMDYAADILSSGRHLLAVINDILDVSRIETGQITLDRETVDVTELVPAVLRLVETRVHQGQVRLCTELPARLPTLMADRRRLLQILVNLLSNAIKFTPEGGRVNLEVRTEGEWMILEVADTGIGMCEADMAVALEPFRQVDGTLARRYGGAGLGLPLAKACAELHGGSLVLSSEPGQGTVVTVKLPLAEEPSQRQPAKSAAAQE